MCTSEASFGVLKNRRRLSRDGWGPVKDVRPTQECARHGINHLIKKETRYAGMELRPKFEVDLYVKDGWCVYYVTFSLAMSSRLTSNSTVQVFSLLGRPGVIRHSLTRCSNRSLLVATDWKKHRISTRRIIHLGRIFFLSCSDNILMNRMDCLVSNQWKANG